MQDMVLGKSTNVRKNVVIKNINLRVVRQTVWSVWSEGFQDFQMMKKIHICMYIIESEQLYIFDTDTNIYISVFFLESVKN